jgi:hypothetical protein
VCGIGPTDEPINGDNTIPQSFEATMKMWGVDDKELDRIRQTIVNGSERLPPFFIAFLAIITAKMRPGFLTINKNLIGQDHIANI